MQIFFSPAKKSQAVPERHPEGGGMSFAAPETQRDSF